MRHLFVNLQRKVDYIKRTTQILKDKYDGDIPNTIKELCELPGEILVTSFGINAKEPMQS